MIHHHRALRDSCPAVSYVTCSSFVHADGICEATRGSSCTAQHHVQSGAIRELHRAAGETSPERLQVCKLAHTQFCWDLSQLFVFNHSPVRWLDNHASPPFQKKNSGRHRNTRFGHHLRSVHLHSQTPRRYPLQTAQSEQRVHRHWTHESL